MPDLFETPELIPDNVLSVLNDVDTNREITYFECEALVKQLNDVGYSCDYDLGSMPYNLIKL
jgi:hypothetical protein